MKNLTSSAEIENSLSIMCWGFSGNTIWFHEDYDITREKENVFFPIAGIEAREGAVRCIASGKKRMAIPTARKPVWESFTLEEQLRIHEAVKQEYYRRQYGDFAYQLDVMTAKMRESILSMGRRGEKVRFTESEAPRFYHDGAWRTVTELRFPDSLRPEQPGAPVPSIIAGWHDDRCLAKGANARMSLSCLPIECQRDIFLLMCRRRAASHI